MKEKSLIKSFDINIYRAQKLPWNQKEFRIQAEFYKSLMVLKLEKNKEDRGYSCKSMKLRCKEGKKTRIIEGRDLDYRLTLLNGWKGEKAWLQNNDVIIQIPLSLRAQERTDWLSVASNFFMHIITDLELIKTGEDFRRIKDKPYHKFSVSSHKQNLSIRYIKASDSVPWGADTETKKYNSRRDRWIKKEYEKYIKKGYLQEEAYEKVSGDLYNQPLKQFGDWPNKERNPKTGKWQVKEGTRDPLKLESVTIKLIVRGKF